MITFSRRWPNDILDWQMLTDERMPLRTSADANNESLERRFKRRRVVGLSRLTRNRTRAMKDSPEQLIIRLKRRLSKYDELFGQSKKTETLNLWKAKHQELQKILSNWYG